jgi:putative oxidoreductase
MAAGHGWAKLTGFAEMAERFPDPLGLGSPTMSLALTVFAEFFCATAVVLGLATRFAAVPLVVTMVVAALLIHADDPFAKKELALLYAVPFITLIFTGAGKFSVDANSRFGFLR